MKDFKVNIVHNGANTDYTDYDLDEKKILQGCDVIADEIERITKQAVKLNKRVEIVINTFAEEEEKGMNDIIKLEMKSDNSKTWRDTTLQNLYDTLKVTRSILRERMKFMVGKDEIIQLHSTIEDYTEDKALWNIKAGKTIYTPILQFRLAEGMTCPKCDAKFIDVCGALSRRDNKMKICSSCGTLEAMEDMLSSRK
jgi:hypothetical protein